VRRALAGLLLFAAAGCGAKGEGFFLPAPPPTNWPSELLEARRAKDEFFRTDPNSPLPASERASFRGLDYWPPDPAYRFAGTIRRFSNPERFHILTTAGERRPCERYGELRFVLHGTACRLTVYRLLDEPARPGASELFLPFTDETSGKETYPAGRYVQLEGPEGGPYVLDFNTAYNPSCAYGDPERFRCPVTPRENRLPVRVEAGERGYRGGAASGEGGS
jgi:hypothetical protein